MQLADELHKCKKMQSLFSFKCNIWGADLADMQLKSKYTKGIKFLLCAIDIFSKYAFVVALKDRKGATIVNDFKVF